MATGPEFEGNGRGDGDEQIETQFWALIRRRIEEKAHGEADFVCAVCAGSEWLLSEQISPLMAQPYEAKSGFDLHIGRQSAPCVAVVCTNCGNTLLLNILVLLGEDAKRFPPYDQPLGGP